MCHLLSLLSLLLLALIHLSRFAHGSENIQEDPISFETRAHWMRKANLALSELDSSCPFAAFGTVIVNHTDISTSPHGKLICYSINQNHQTGNPTLHGEISGINNCTSILTDPRGEYKLTCTEAIKAFQSLSLYTNAEPCPMCASAIRWAGFAETVFGTSIETLVSAGWNQISLSTEDVFEVSGGLGTTTRLLKGVLSNQTDSYFLWQFDEGYPCPAGCVRKEGSCRAVDGEGHEEL